MVPWEFRICETTASGKDMWLEERRIWCLPFEQEVPELHPRPIKAKMMALQGIFRKLEVAMGRDCDSILRRMAALRALRGVEDDPAMDAQWFEHLRASATAREPPLDGLTTGSPWTMQVVKAIIKCSGEMQNDLLWETSRRELP